VELRNATADIAGFLVDMLLEAYNWSGDQRVTRLDVESDPQLRRYVADWPRGQDFGLVALAEDGAPVGAAWARTFPRMTGSWLRRGGHPRDHRGRRGVAARARHRASTTRGSYRCSTREGWRAVSLSVEDGNRVVQLYRAVGFVTVGRVRNSDTMLLDLRA
jgi:hypothetical protein